MRRPFLLAAVLALALLAACDQGPAPTPTPGASPGLTATDPGGAPPPTDSGPTEPAPEIPTALPTIELPPPPTLPPTPSGMDDTQVVEIYDLVVRDLIQPTPPPYIAIAPTASQGEQLDMPVADQPLPNSLLDRLKDRGVPVELVQFIEAIGPLETGGRVQNDGIFLTLGVIEQDADPTNAALYASWYRASDDATGYRYELTRTADRWTIKNRTQVWDQ